MMDMNGLSSPLFVSWQLTRDCDLACLHCCTESAPGKALPDELSREEAIRLAGDIVACRVPYVMLCGGEPTLAPHFFETAELLGQGGVQLKIETNGQRFGPAQARRLSRLPIRSVQVSLDGATQAVYSGMRPGASLNAALQACRAVREAGLPLEITFAPTRLNIGQADRVLDLALELGAFRFNTGRLMRVGTAARLWDRLEPSASEYAAFFSLLEAKEWEFSERMELCFRPSSLEEALRETAAQPPAALLVLPNGKIKASAALPFLCGDLRTMSLKEAWGAYQAAWKDERVLSAASALLKDPSRTALSNRWIDLAAAKGPRSPERGRSPLAKGAAPQAACQARPPAGSRATVKETR